MLTTHAHLVSWLRMSEAIFIAPQYTTMTWTAANLLLILLTVCLSDLFQTSFVQNLKYLQMLVR